MSIGKKITLGSSAIFLAATGIFVWSVFFNAPEMSYVKTENTSKTSPTSQTTIPVANDGPAQQQAIVSPHGTPAVRSAPELIPAPTTTYVPPTTPPRCTDQMRALEDEGYQIYIQAEEARYQSALNSALGALQERGMGFSGQADLVRQQQAQIHSQKLAQIDSQHLARLAQYDCS